MQGWIVPPRKEPTKSREELERDREKVAAEKEKGSLHLS
jgi:hypothetical protein